MKTRKEWIDTLPDDIRERAYKYAEKDILGRLEPGLFPAISGAFVWDETPEEHEFWSLVARSKFDEARVLLTKNTTKP